MWSLSEQHFSIRVSHSFDIESTKYKMEGSEYMYTDKYMVVAYKKYGREDRMV